MTRDEGCIMGGIRQIENNATICLLTKMVMLGHTCHIVPGHEPARSLPSWYTNCPKEFFASGWNGRTTGVITANYHRHPLNSEICVWDATFETKHGTYDIPTWSEKCNSTLPPEMFHISWPKVS
jgi:hypothetical protein